MKLVIEIPEQKHKAIVDGYYAGILDNDLYVAIKGGTPLPKGHGRLIDADDLIQELSVVSSRPIKSQLYILKEAPTIIEADKAESEG